MDKNSTKDIANLAYSFTNGDYVMYKGKMDRIDAHMGGKVHLEKRQDSVFVEELKPVIITVDILEKIGFEHTDEDWFTLVFDHSLFRMRANIIIAIIFSVFNKENNSGFSGEIKYLHKLQQLLRGMDIDFEITKLL